MKGREVGIAAGVFAYPGGENCSRAYQTLPGFGRNALSLPASQIDAFATNFPHQRGAVFVGARPVGHGVDKGALLIEDIGDERYDAVDLLLAVGKAFQKHRHVIV